MTTSHPPQSPQTPLTRSPSSAEFARQRAQSFAPRAADAPGFAGVLEAFAQPAEDTELIKDQQPVEDADQPESESADETVDKAAGQTKQASQEEAQASQDNQSNQSSQSSQSPARPDGEEVKAGQNAGSTKTINSIQDLESLLINAASVDLAGLATQQLKADPASQPLTDSRPNSSTSASTPASTPASGEPGKNGFDSASPSRPFAPHEGKPPGIGMDYPFGKPPAGLSQNQGSFMGQGNTAGDMLSQSQSGAQKAQAMSIDPAVQTPPLTPRSVENHQPIGSGKLFAAQAVQAQASNLTGEARRLQTIRSIAEMPVGQSKPKEIAGSEAAGKQGAQDSGLDLGNKPQNIAKLLQSNPADDRAMQRQQVLAQVQRGLASILNTKGGTMKIRLSPEHLGEVNIQLSTKDGRVSVQINAKNESTRNMLSDGLEGLRSAIEARGAIVDKLHVDGQQQSSFEQLFGRQGDPDQRGTGGHKNHQDSGSGDQAGDGGGQERSDLGERETLHNQPRGIWTELGLDAIA